MPRSTRRRRVGKPRRARAARRGGTRLVREIRQNVGKYVAISEDWSRVVAVGRTFAQALAHAREAGFPEAGILLACRDYGAVAF